MIKLKKFKKILHECKKANIKQFDISNIVYLFDYYVDQDFKSGMIDCICDTIIYFIKFEDYKYWDEYGYVFYPCIRIENKEDIKFYYNSFYNDKEVGALISLACELGSNQKEMVEKVLRNIKFYENT